ncbi:MAG TPA: YkgJ family cysteine cluster protein [Armatimonadota bacterium]|jgi:hypothetical protein
MNDWNAPCDGCITCALRCTAGIKISEFEYTRIVEELRSQEASAVRKVLAQEKHLIWFEEIRYEACLFLNTETRLCLIYPARPLICRLFGRVKHLPCPAGWVPADFDARDILQAYAAQPLKTFQEWMGITGVFNFDDLLGGKDVLPCYDISEEMAP